MVLFVPEREGQPRGDPEGLPAVRRRQHREDLFPESQGATPHLMGKSGKVIILRYQFFLGKTIIFLMLDFWAIFLSGPAMTKHIFLPIFEISRLLLHLSL